MGGRQREPFSSAPDTGRMAFRNEWEPRDERPCIVYPHPFWKDEDERLRYERAAAHCPVSASGKLTLDEYLAEVAKVATGLRPSGHGVFRLLR